MGLDYLVDDLTLEINFNIQLGEAIVVWEIQRKKDFYFKSQSIIKNKNSNE
jgi:hypothetical protein